MGGDRKDYGNGNSTAVGYLVEWRLRPESAAIAEFNDFHDAKEIWKRAPYEARKMTLSGGAESMVRPVIQDYFGDQMAEHNIVDRDVGEAIIACLKTNLHPKMRKHIEFRLTRVKLHKSFRIVEDPNSDPSAEEFQTTIGDALKDKDHE